MCLSDVFAFRNGKEELLMRNVASVRQEGEKLIFSNILGVLDTVKGTIRSIDLMENIIRIDLSEEGEHNEETV